MTKSHTSSLHPPQQQNVSTVVVVGVGDYIDQSVLEAITSPGSNSYIIHNPHDLALVAGKLLEHVCPGESEVWLHPWV